MRTVNMPLNSIGPMWATLQIPSNWNSISRIHLKFPKWRSKINWLWPSKIGSRSFALTKYAFSTNRRSKWVNQSRNRFQIHRWQGALKRRLIQVKPVWKLFFWWRSFSTLWSPADSSTSSCWSAFCRLPSICHYFRSLFRQISWWYFRLLSQSPCLICLKTTTELVLKWSWALMSRIRPWLARTYLTRSKIWATSLIIPSIIWKLLPF